MTDWSKLKVADLKEECKARDIPLTGLKLKQQYIDKLEEYEASQETDETEAPENVDAPPSEQKEPEAQPNESPENESNPALQAEIGVGDVVAEADKDVTSQETDTADKSPSPQEEPVDDGNDEAQPISAIRAAEEDKPPALQEEDPAVQSSDHAPDHAMTDEPPIDGDTIFVPEQNGVHHDIEATNDENLAVSIQKVDGLAQDTQHAAADEGSAATVANAYADVSEPPQQDVQATPLLLSTQGTPSTSTPTSSQIPTADLLEDQRKRRKRSLTPVPTSEEMSRKRARLSDAAEEVRKEAAIEDMQAATQVAKEIRGEDVKGAPPNMPSEDSERDATTLVPTTKSPRVDPKLRDLRAASPIVSQLTSEERDVPPAIHPATASIYIRNLKRPLHVPSLRNHIVSLARTRSSDQDPEPITVFFLDTIRTHAFVSFSSVTAASRVRTALHDTRFPDEAMREPLFVDYVPDDKVQAWIDQETGGNSFGGRAAGKRFEVVYEETSRGEIEAIFQEADTRNSQISKRPSLTSRPSIDTGRAKVEIPPSGIHPERAGLVSNRSQHERRPLSPPARPKASSEGVGFKALDDLFPSTTAKPKLYFKPVSDEVARDRMDMFRQLQSNYSDLGRSGDGGMKRYSFERLKGQGEEWVDKGPEFGFGRKGQDRLIGVRGGGRAGFGGGGYRGRGGDSWRGRT